MKRSRTYGETRSQFSLRRTLRALSAEMTTIALTIAPGATRPDRCPSVFGRYEGALCHDTSLLGEPVRRRNNAWPRKQSAFKKGSLGGSVDSVAVREGIVSVADVNTDPHANGSVVPFDIESASLGSVTVGEPSEFTAAVFVVPLSPARRIRANALEFCQIE